MKISKSMRHKSILAPILGLSALLLPVAAIAQTNPSTQVQAVRQPILTDSSITSISEIRADDPIMKREAWQPGHFAFDAAQRLIERYGVTGVVYQDKTVRPDISITTQEAAILLNSAFDMLNGLHGGYFDSLVAYGGFTRAMRDKVHRESLGELKRLILPQGTCIGDVAISTPFADVPTSHNAANAIYRLREVHGRAGLALNSRRFEPNRTLTWGLAMDCLPKPANEAYSQRSFSLQRMPMPQDPISRGDFFVALDAQMDAVITALSELPLEKIPAFAAIPVAPNDVASSKAAYPIFRASPAELGKVSAIGPSVATFIDQTGRVRLPNVATDARMFTDANGVEITSRSPLYPTHRLRFLTARSLGANLSAIAQAVPNHPLSMYKDIAGQPRRDEQFVFEGRRSLGGQGSARPYPVVVHHTQRIVSEPNQVPVLTERTVTAYIEIPSGLIIHSVDSPPQAPESTKFLFPALEAIALAVSLGEPAVAMQAPYMAPAPAR